ncbi:mediator of RNA polymerase II transcription subunit 17 [Microplitis demolitor]|uniref:mediator of RNA polymerase II transcription subunit 17 n=1 Tax=Microplitis demolitor TaxID=69319 RepID=UPI0004CDDC6E|nr:mediator of RNA polymerase II transcription subunit 17 [Microplitis demolitor]
MVSSISISVEAPNENQIQEITYDGQEIYQAPLTLSESLAKTAQRIDFNKTNTSASDTDDFNDESVGDDGENDNKQNSKESFPQNPLLPFDSIRTKLKNAYTEISVLHDVLAVVREKRYMVLDPIPQEPPEVKAMAQVYARKKALEGATNVLLTAAERLKNSRNDVAANRSTSEFHVELLRLRQNWRLKKVSNSIIGDLSYRTAGSKFAQAGIFEVTKADDDESAVGISKSSSPLSSSQATVPSSSSSSSPKTSSLRVSIPTELQGVAYIKVLCQKDQEDLCNFNLNLSAASAKKADSDMHWQQKLEAAQNVLFCKELFNQLAREAIHSHASIPHLVVGNQITASIFPNIHLVIALCHGLSASDSKKSSTSSPSTASTHSAEHDHVLEHSLHQLLREIHHKNTHHSFPHPSSGQFWPSKRRCLAGPSAADRHELLEMTKNQTILDQIIKQTQHYIMRRRAAFVLDSIAKDVKDPIIVSHWNALSTPTLACVKINIWTDGYDTVCRTSLAIYVYEKSFKCVCRDGRVMHMSYEPQELRNLLLCQINQHQILAVQNLAKCMGWQFLANSSHLGLGPVEPLGNAKSCLLASPTGDRMIAVRCDPQNGVQVSTSHSPRTDFYPGQVVRERKWEHQCGPFKEVQWDKMEGKNFLNKMELLMSSLTCSL